MSPVLFGLVSALILGVVIYRLWLLCIRALRQQHRTRIALRDVIVAAWYIRQAQLLEVGTGRVPGFWHLYFPGQEAPLPGAWPSEQRAREVAAERLQTNIRDFDLVLGSARRVLSGEYV